MLVYWLVFWLVLGLVGLTLASSMESPWALMLVYLLDSLAAAKAVEAVVAVFLRVLADWGAGSDVVGIFVTKKLLIGWHFLAAKANWDLADLPIGGSFVGLFVGSFGGSSVGSFVGSWTWCFTIYCFDLFDC